MERTITTNGTHRRPLLDLNLTQERTLVWHAPICGTLANDTAWRHADAGHSAPGKSDTIVRGCFSRGSWGKVGEACVSVPLGIRSKLGTAHHPFSLTMRAVVADRMALGIVRLRPVLTNPLAFAMLTFNSGFRRLGHGVLFFATQRSSHDGQAPAPPLHRSPILGFERGCIVRDQDDKRPLRFDSAGVFGGDIVDDSRLDPGLPRTIRPHARLPCLL
jgi:hypothetical protein